MISCFGVLVLNFSFIADRGLKQIVSDERPTRQDLAQAPPTSSVSNVTAASGGNSTETQRQAGSDHLNVIFREGPLASAVGPSEGVITVVQIMNPRCGKQWEEVWEGVQAAKARITFDQD